MFKPKNKMSFLYKYLSNHKEELTIIYTLTVKDAEFVYKKLMNLQEQGFKLVVLRKN